jgi:hypothetical protein
MAMPTGDIDSVIARFLAAPAIAGSAVSVQTEVLAAPHKPRSLSKGWQGVYSFRFVGVWLKVGKAGPNSNARWLSQHYRPLSAQSTLAWSLLRYAHEAREAHPRLPSGFRERIAAVDPDGIGAWIKQNTERVNLKISAELGRTGLAILEEIALETLHPVFEGQWLREIAG